MSFGAAEPWAFTQEQPLATSQFVKAARVRGIKISDGVLAELWRIGALAPCIEIVDDPVHPPLVPTIPEPLATGTHTTEIRMARAAGRLTNPGDRYRPDVELHRIGVSATDSWNGFLYSRWQLIALRWLQPLFAALDPSVLDEVES